MDARYVKTEAGRAELKDRRLALPRQARLLLVIIDASKSGPEWVAAVNGSSQADLDRLCEAGLIGLQGESPRSPAPAPSGRSGSGSSAATGSSANSSRNGGTSSNPTASATTAAHTTGGATGGSPAPSSPAREPDTPSPTLPALSEAALAELVQSLSYRQLYDLMTAQARPRLGLISGYRMVLEVERCSGADDVRALALRFVESVRQAQGAEGVRQICNELRALAPVTAP